MPSWPSQQSLVDFLSDLSEQHGAHTTLRDVIRCEIEKEGVLSDGDHHGAQRGKQAAARRRPGGGSFSLS